MPTVRLKFSRPWYEQILAQARQAGQTPEQLLQGLIALSIPPPEPTRSTGLPHEQALVDSISTLAHNLDVMRNQLVNALDRLASTPRRHRARAARAASSAWLRATMKKKGLTQSDIAERIGVTRTAISAVLIGRMSLPPAWQDLLADALGEGCTDERVEG